MNRYRIADLIVDMEFVGDLSNQRSEKYKIEYDSSVEADLTVNIAPKDIQAAVEKSKFPIRFDDYEYVMTGTRFYRSLINYDGFFLHSSAIVLNNKAYLFSAPSGTGKSTHTALWEEYFKNDNAYVINDDKPALRLGKDGNFYVYGTPWSGKTDKNVNACVPLGAICFLERSEENHIEKMNSSEAIQKLIWQTVRPKRVDDLSKLLALYNKLIEKYGIYKMQCKIDFDAVRMAYDVMGSKEKKDED